MSQNPKAYDSSIRDDLDKVDWDAVLPKVLKYAIWRAKKFAWLGDQADPELLAQEAISRAYGVGTGGAYRNWDKEACPDIIDFLTGIIRSMTSHMAEHEADFPQESLFNKDGSLKDNKLFKSFDETVGVLQLKTPEVELIEAENLQALMVELDDIENEDEDMGMVILCIKDEISKPRDIAHETGFDVSKVNNVLRRLRRRLKHFNHKLRERSSKERREE